MSKLPYTKQDIFINSPEIKKLIAENKDSNMAKQIYMNNKKVAYNDIVTDPDKWTKYSGVFDYVRRTNSKSKDD